MQFQESACKIVAMEQKDMDDRIYLERRFPL